MKRVYHDTEPLTKVNPKTASRSIFNNASADGLLIPEKTLNSLLMRPGYPYRRC